MKRIEIIGLLLSAIVFSLCYILSKFTNVYDIGVGLGFGIGVSELTLILIAYNIAEKKRKAIID